MCPLADDLTELPPAVLLAAEYDVLRDDAEQLTKAGVPAVIDANQQPTINS